MYAPKRSVLKINPVTSVILWAAWLSACSMPPAEGQLDTGNVVQASQALQVADQRAAEARTNYTPLAVSDEQAASFPAVAPSAGPALDARAAAAAEPASDAQGLLPTTKLLATWYTGSVAPGAQQHWFWHNSGAGVYKVGFSPVGAGTADACQFQLVRSWDEQPPGSVERQFHFVVQNVGYISCAAQILLQSQAADDKWSTGGLKPGDIQGWTWNNANPLTAAHFVNVSPNGSTSTDACQFEVIRSWYAQQPGGERKFYFWIKNIGGIACAGDILLATNNNVDASWSTGTVIAGGATAWFWNNANPLTRVYVPGISPLGAWGTNSCQLELLPTYYQQAINPDGTSQRRYAIGVKNVGAMSCAGNLLLNYLD